MDGVLLRACLVELGGITISTLQPLYNIGGRLALDSIPYIPHEISHFDGAFGTGETHES
jgi:hypothetical protein